MSLALYRRHRQECKGGHRHNSRTSEYDERKKDWKRCECPIFVSGSLARLSSVRTPVIEFTKYGAGAESSLTYQRRSMRVSQRTGHDFGATGRASVH